MTSSPTRRSPLAVLIAVLALVASACGGGDRVIVSNPIVEPVGELAPTDAEGSGEADPEATGIPAAGSEQPSSDTGEASGPVDDGDLPDDFVFDFGDAGSDDADPDDAAATTDEGATNGFDVSSLKAVANTTEDSTSYRFEVWLDWVMADSTFSLDLSPDTPLVTGSVTGGASAYAADLGPFMSELFAELGEENVIRDLFGGDLSIQVVDDGEGRLYMYAPLIASLAGDASLPESFAALGTGWGVADLTQVTGVSATELAGLTGAQGGSSPEAVLELLRSAGTVEELGRAEVRGVATDHLRVGVTLGQLVEAQGTDMADLEAFAGDIGSVLDVEFPFDLFVDDDGRVRRVTLTFDLAALESLIGEAAPAGTTFSMTTIMDFFDYDDPSIAVTPPPADEVVVDLTGDLQALFG